MQPIAVYVHIPFCIRKCAYCDFVSYAGKECQWDAYVRTLIGEIGNWRERMTGRTVQTIFFGGGTPSVLPSDVLCGILGSIAETFDVAPNAEITLEANPGTVTPASLSNLRRGGFNRISFGVQSFDDGLLRALGRIHTAQEARDALRMAKSAGFDNINLDLIYALPGQTASQWHETLRTAVSLSPAHISAYSLILEEGTPMWDMAQHGDIGLPDEEEVLRMQRDATEFLGENGYRRYEISNYAQPGRECRHNLTYWRRGDYLGLGCAAHSLVDGRRFHDPASMEEYLQGVRMQDEEILTREDRVTEALMLATRTCEGLSLEEFREISGEELTEYAPEAVRFVADGLAKIENGSFILTERGMEMQDAVVLEMLH